MVEKCIRDHLAGELPVPVYMEVPEEAPASFIVLEKTGSGRSNHIHMAAIAAQSYGGTLYEAAQLNETVKQAMDSLARLDVICSVKLVSDHNFTDTESKRYRYQAVFDITHY